VLLSTRSAHVVAILALLAVQALSASCRRGPPFRLQPGAHTIQAQCGVTPGVDVSEAQATCIALLVGLSPGTAPWSVRDMSTDPVSPEPVWRITNTTKAGYKPEYCGASGLSVSIAKADGTIYSMLPWEKLCIKD